MDPNSRNNSRPDPEEIKELLQDDSSDEEKSSSARCRLKWGEVKSSSGIY